MTQLGSGNGTGYPTAIDTRTTEVNAPASGKTKARAEVANDLLAAVVAMQTAVGANPVKRISQYASLTAAVAAIGSTNTTLLIDSATTIEGATTIPSTLSIECRHQGIITKSSGTLTINGHFSAGLYQVFSGFSAGDVTFGSITSGTGSAKEVFPDWWGYGGVSTDSSTFVQAAVSSLPRGGKIRLVRTGYLFTSGVTVSNATITIEGNNKVINFITTTSDITMFSFTNGASYSQLQDIELEGPGVGVSTKPGVLVTNTHDLLFNSIYVTKFKYGVQYAPGVDAPQSSYSCMIRDSIIVGNKEVNIYLQARTNFLTLYNTQFGGVTWYGINAIDSPGLQIYGGDVEGITAAAIQVTQSGAGLSGNIFITGVDFESSHPTDGYIVIGDSAGGRIDSVTIINNFFHTDTTTPQAINARANGMVILGNGLRGGTFTNGLLVQTDINNLTMLGNGLVGDSLSMTSLENIKFPATQVASSNVNTLDDYEEGDFSITDASGAGLSLTSAIGAYTKIGNRVEGTAYVAYPATADGSNAILGGLPFTAANSSRVRGGVSISFTDSTNAKYTFLLENSTTFRIYDNGGVQTTNAQMSGKTITVSFNYNVD